MTLLGKLCFAFAFSILFLWSACKKEQEPNPVVPTDTTIISYPDTTIPAPPSNLHAVLLNSHSVALLWQDNSRRETGFRIERSVADTNHYEAIGTVDSNVVAFTDSVVNPMGLNFYRAFAYNSYGSSPYSNIDSIVVHTFGRADQEAIAPTLMSRMYETAHLVDQYQRGYAALHSYPDTLAFLPQTNGSYEKVTGDTLRESVRFNPDIWRNPALTQDSTWYRWDLYSGDTVRRGKYSYEVNGKRLGSDSIASDTGTVRFDLQYFGVGWGGAWNDYSYWLSGTFFEPVDLQGASYQWTGIGISYAVDLTPIRWVLSGSSTRDAGGQWNIEFDYAQVPFMTASIDSAGVGNYRLKWNNFATPYGFRYNP